MFLLAWLPHRRLSHRPGNEVARPGLAQAVADGHTGTKEAAGACGVGFRLGPALG
jgi:hypothetical protein